MSTFWETVRKNISAGIHTVSEKTDELTKIGRLKIEIVAVKRDIEKSFMELGGRVYDLLKSDKKISMAKDSEIQNLTKKISGFEDRLDQLESEVVQIQEMKSKKPEDGNPSGE